MNSLIVHQRYPHDNFTFNLFEKIVNLRDVDGLFIYSHHWAFVNSCEGYFNLINNAKQNLIILGIKDHYVDIMDDLLTEMSIKNPTKKFILIMSHENLKNKVLMNRSNILDVLSWGGDWTNQIKFYQESDVLINKKLTDFTFTCHMRRSNKDRRIMLSLLYGLKIENRGLITASNWANSPGGAYVSTYFKDLYIQHKNIIKILQYGCSRAPGIVPNIPYDPKFEKDVFNTTTVPFNFENFKRYLLPNYERAPIDIVVESEMTNNSPFFTEKSLHCFYAKSLPIIISGTGAIQHCRDVGFDVFDDIIDHSYDLIDDRLLRIYSAVNLNLNLLKNKNLMLKKYRSIDPSRLEHNINVVKNIMCGFYEQRLEKDYMAAIKKYFERK